MAHQIPILQIEGLSVCFSGKTVLENVSLSIPARGCYGLLGPNGGGKTTLLKAVLGLVEIDSGKFFLSGEDLQKKPKKRQKIGYVPQRHTFLSDYPIEVEELLAQSLLTSLRPFRRFSVQEKERLWYYLDLLGISHLAKQVVRNLSGGELQRALIARALLAEPELLLLDEPLSYLDPDSKENFQKILFELSRKMTMLMVSHESLPLDAQFVEVFVLNRRILYRGSSLEVDKALREGGG